MNSITLSILNLITSQIGDISLSEIDLTLILNKFTELQNSITGLTVQDGVIASADVILLAAGVQLFLDQHCSFVIGFVEVLVDGSPKNIVNLHKTISYRGTHWKTSAKPLKHKLLL